MVFSLGRPKWSVSWCSPDATAPRRKAAAAGDHESPRNRKVAPACGVRAGGTACSVRRRQKVCLFAGPLVQFVGDIRSVHLSPPSRPRRRLAPQRQLLPRKPPVAGRPIQASTKGAWAFQSASPPIAIASRPCRCKRSSIRPPSLFPQSRSPPPLTLSLTTPPIHPTSPVSPALPIR
jgi:hypothetical protein